MAEKNCKKRIWKILIPAVLLLGAAALLFTVFGKPKAQREDYRQISSTKYDTVFLSMYPIDTYEEKEFLAYRGMTVCKASYCIPKFSVMKQYMKRIAKSGNTITTVYLGIRPDITDLDELQALINLYPSASFEIILAYPSMDYWTGLSEEEYSKLLAVYCDFLNIVSGISNAHFYYMGSQEWLIANPANYETPWLVNTDIAKTIMLQSDILNRYLVTGESAPAFAQALTELTRKERTESEVFPDLSDYNIVLFGDSVIGNYSDSTSIPEVVAGLSGASAFNCGFGGNSASVNPDAPINLPGIAEAFVREDLSPLPENTQLYRGVSSYFSNALPDKKMCFVINYGLNDYFAGYPLRSETDPLDVTTFEGAIRTTVNTIYDRYPDAVIVLCTPSFCAFYYSGTEPRGEEGHVLLEYVEATQTLAQELPVYLLDTYYGLGANEDNWGEYLLPDYVHPNETYRYLIGREIVRLIGQHL